MTRFSCAGLAAAAVLGIGSVASAADLPTKAPIYKAPPPVVAYDWSGFYIGADAGYGWGDAKYHFNTAGWWNNVAGDEATQRMNGFLGGGHAGWNWQTGAWVLGLEGSFLWSDVKSGVQLSPYFPATDDWESRIHWLATVTPRAGYAINNWLFYAKGGAAFANIRSRFSDPRNPPEWESLRTVTRTGWTVGGGVETGLTPNWIAGVEGNYYDFGSFNVNQVTVVSTGLPAGGLGVTDHDVHTTMWSVLGRLSYKFGAH